MKDDEVYDGVHLEPSTVKKEINIQMGHDPEFKYVIVGVVVFIAFIGKCLFL